MLGGGFNGMRIEGEDAGADTDEDMLGVGGREKVPLYIRICVSGISQ
jgi:hypothetical protein